MKIIKVNYNNVYISKPGSLSPFVFSYRSFGKNELDNLIHIVVNDRLSEDNYYIDFYFEILVNGISVAFMNRNSEREIVIDNPELYSAETINVTIKGYYRDEYNKYYFNDVSKDINILPYCNENITAGNNIVVNNMYKGYLRNNNRFYLTKLDDNIYTDEVVNKDGSLYYDLDTLYLYKYLTQQKTFVKV